jgi:hypothetical protein
MGSESVGHLPKKGNKRSKLVSLKAVFSSALSPTGRVQRSSRSLGAFQMSFSLFAPSRRVVPTEPHVGSSLFSLAYAPETICLQRTKNQGEILDSTKRLAYAKRLE